jgi:hypothetical protein
MSVSTVSRLRHATWQQTAQNIVCGDPPDVLDRLRAVVDEAPVMHDHEFCVALSAHALAFMLVDWSRFTGWQAWSHRFEENDAQLGATPAGGGLALVRAMGAVACALLRGDTNQTLAPLGQRLESLLDTADNPVQLALAAGVLLPWLQMSKNPAAAQALHARMETIAGGVQQASPGLQYLRGAWLVAWGLHLHFTDRSRISAALEAIDQHLVACPSPYLRFRRVRLAVEQALYERNIDLAESEMRQLLSAMHVRRPMERVIYNMMASTIANTRNDPDRALLHVTHNLRDLEAADCPPSVSSVYRLAETRVYLARRDYRVAAEIYEQLSAVAHTAHAATYCGYASLARALLAHQSDASSNEALREYLRSGLSAVRAIPAINFFIATPEARASVCALALREGIECEFVRASLQAFPVTPPVWADEHWPWAMSLRCFGGFRCDGLGAEGRGAGKASNRPMNLLMLVAAHGAPGVPVAVAADALWPGQDGDQAENALSVTLLRLRRMHTEADLVERRGGWLHLNPQRVWTDVMALEAHLQTMPDAGHGHNAFAAYIARLFDLYRGDCLFGIDDEWAQARATHYRVRVTTTIKAVLRGALQAGHLDAAEQALTFAHERGMGAARLLTAIGPHPAGAVDSSRLQRHADWLEAGEKSAKPGSRGL